MNIVQSIALSMRYSVTLKITIFYQSVRFGILAFPPDNLLVTVNYKVIIIINLVRFFELIRRYRRINRIFHQNGYELRIYLENGSH